VAGAWHSEIEDPDGTKAFQGLLEELTLTSKDNADAEGDEDPTGPTGAPGVVEPWWVDEVRTVLRVGLAVSQVSILLIIKCPDTTPVCGSRGPHYVPHFRPELHSERQCGMGAFGSCILRLLRDMFCLAHPGLTFHLPDSKLSPRGLAIPEEPWP
jgi:hypothetical protein